MVDISEEELDWIADKFILYGYPNNEDSGFYITKIKKYSFFGTCFKIRYKYYGTEYGMCIQKDEQDKK